MPTTALPPAVQKRVDYIANRAIANARRGVSHRPKIDEMFSEFTRRASGAASDSVQLNHLGGKIGKR